MRVESLRALVQAIQAHPNVTLAPASTDDSPAVSSDSLSRVTRLHISNGYVMGCSLADLNVRITITLQTHLCGGLFEGTTFSSLIGFGGSVFDGWTSFKRAHFAAEAWFDGADFCQEALFDGAIFKEVAHFEGTRFDGEANFGGVRFESGALFEQAVFKKTAYFRKAGFCRNASFKRARFISKASFCDVHFDGVAWFESSFFADEAYFDSAHFWDDAVFAFAHFSDDLYLQAAIFERKALFGRVIVGHEALLHDAAFEDECTFEDMLAVFLASMPRAIVRHSLQGDMRAVDVHKVEAAIENVKVRAAPWLAIYGWEAERKAHEHARRESRERPWEPQQARAVPITKTCSFSSLWILFKSHKSCGAHWRVMWTMVRDRGRWGLVDWHHVRALGKLTILNRVSLVAILAVPVLAAGYIAAQKIVAESEGEQVPIWIRWMARAIGGSPHLSETLAFAFFASVFVTLGLLIYQTFAPDTIKQRDEDEHVRDLETRYSDENPSLRGDGLRRSIERLEDQAKVRPNRHPSFVRHHGDTIWIPPRDKLEWFRDDDLEEEPFRARVREALRGMPRVEHEPGSTSEEAEEKWLDERMKKLKIVPPKQRPGFVPAAERARICIEEGARAEYWLKSHEKIGWAWVSLLCYLLGIAILLVILFIQCRSVAKAAWWPEMPTEKRTG